MGCGAQLGREALDQPFEDDPGRRMLYPNGSSHLLSTSLTRATGRTMLENAQAWLGPVEGFSIAAWARDPQGSILAGTRW